MVIWQPRIRTPEQLLWELLNEELKEKGGEDRCLVQLWWL